jgi:DNA-binding LacI/PurR family transcriptional regulator
MSTTVGRRLSFIDLTSVRQDAAEVADLAVQAAVERLEEGRTMERDIVLQPILIERGSTAAPPICPRTARPAFP